VNDTCQTICTLANLKSAISGVFIIGILFFRTFAHGQLIAKIFIMKTIVVPVDFSRTSINTAHYAMKMVAGKEDVKVIFYHAYEKATEAAEAQELLAELQTKMSEYGVGNITVHAEESPDLADALAAFARHNGATLIVMGLTGKSKLQQFFLSSKTLKIVDKNPCPVLIVPPSATFNQIKNVALTSDFQEVGMTIPYVPIKSILELFQPNLHIVNVNSEHYVSLTEDFLEQRGKFATMFQEYKPEFYFIGTYDFHDTINLFVNDKHIDLVITIPKSHSFIENLFKPNNTKKLVFESTVPVLAAHE
jgi:nucleotide-binding universal stress UspA family protein